MNMKTRTIRAGQLEVGDRVVVHTTWFGFGDNSEPDVCRVVRITKDRWNDGVAELDDGRDVEFEAEEEVEVVA